MNRYFSIFVLIIIGISFSFVGCNNDKEVTGVSIYPSICVLQVDETIHLNATVTPHDADNQTVRWVVNTLYSVDSISDVASISQIGKVTALAEGFASAVCITNDGFYEDKTGVMVGYATAVAGLYNGSLSENNEVINTAAKIGIVRLSEYEATFGLPFLNDSATCPVTVDYQSEKLQISGSLEGDTTTVKVTGAVTLDGLGSFEIVVEDLSSNVTTYSFFGTINRPF